MEVRNAKIAQAAIAVVSRYGLRKTTMGDLAQAAGVSRQTLYNAYENKDEVIRDAIRFVTAQTIDDVQAAWAQNPTLAAQIDAFFEIGPLSWFDWIKSTPDASDLIDGLNNTGGAEMAEGTAKWIAAIAALFAPHAERLDRLGQTPDMVARFIYQSAHAAKTQAHDRAELITRLATLKASVLALAGDV